MRVAPLLASKVKVARPLPVPLAVVCSQEALAVAVQAPVAATMSESVPPAGPSSRVVVPSEEGGPLGRHAIFWPRTVMWAVRAVDRCWREGETDHAVGDAAEGQPGLVAAGGENAGQQCGGGQHRQQLIRHPPPPLR